VAIYKNSVKIETTGPLNASLEELHFTDTSPIFAVSCVMIALGERSSEHVFFFVWTQLFFEEMREGKLSYADLT
jgi:hypothetical protein